MKYERIGALADGIFAIAMTLLILDIHVPLQSALRWSDLSILIPKLLTLAVSFIILAIYWSSHHFLFDRLEKASFKFMWRNLWFLLAIVIVPFVTSLLGEYPYSQVAQIVYSSVLFVCGVQLYSVIFYSIHKEMLLREMPSVEFRRNVAGKILLPPVMYVLAVALSFWNTHVSLLFLVAGPLVYFLPIDGKVWTVLTKPFSKYIV